MDKLLLCCDLDRTLIPNGDHPESPDARPLFSQIAEKKEVILAYISGRNKQLIQEAIESYDLPTPQYAVGDVGTTVYQPGKNWSPLDAWSEQIQKSWNHLSREDLEAQLYDLSILLLQEPEHQNIHKLSYYVDPDIDATRLKEEIQRYLAPSGVDADVIWSVDEQRGTALVDILPLNASKHHAIRFLGHRETVDAGQTLFAGDSGNDLDALTSGIQSVLVKNASDDVRRMARERMTSRPDPDLLYFAEGDFLGMNGCYSAGILEGLSHFFPETRDWMFSSKIPVQE